MAINGQLDVSTLVDVGDGEYLEAGTAQDFEALRLECLDDTGVWLIVTPDGGGYRTIDQQWATWNYYQKYGSPIAAYPGTSSHGWGRAVDIWNWSAAFAWLEANCERFGFVRNTPSEGWHYAHASIAPTTSSGTAFDNETEDEDMKPYLVSDGAATYLCVPGRSMIHVDGPAALTAIRAMLTTPTGQVAALGSLAAVQAVERHWKQIAPPPVTIGIPAGSDPAIQTLAAKIDAIPTAQENADAGAAEFGDRADGLNDGK